MSEDGIHAVLVALVVLILGGVCLACWVVFVRYFRGLGGWQALAGRFPAAARPDAPAFRCQSAYVHGVAYEGAVLLIPSAEGCFARIHAPFAWGKTPVLIPWSAFAALRERRSVFGLRHYDLVLSGAPRAVFVLWRSAGDAVRAHLAAVHAVVPGRTLFPFHASAGAPTDPARARAGDRQPR
jgi:hypothetical protein